tara:strand:+ start:3557 stop:4672 length:1116 start_codon:yes stop_codon:yes gene_type:complete
MIKLSKSCISKGDKLAVKRLLDKEFLGMGPETKKFESQLENFFGRSVICTANGTSALQIALQSLGFKKGLEVLVPSITYLASYQAITAAGYVPISCDIETKSGNISIDSIKKNYTKKTRVIMPVHFVGDPQGLHKIYSFARTKKLRVIEDAAHAFGSFLGKKKIGSFGDVSCFSFDGIKNITSAEGGAIVTNDLNIIKRARDIRTLGVKGDSINRYQKKRTWNFQVEEQGWRYHMSDLNAALGISQLSRFSSFAKKRQKLAKKYDDNLIDLNEIKIFKRDYTKIVPHIYPIILKDPNCRKEIMEFLKSKKIETGIHYYPNHLLKYFKSSIRSSLQNAENIFPSLLTLPLHPDLSMKDIKYISSSIYNFFNK